MGAVVALVAFVVGARARRREQPVAGPENGEIEAEPAPVEEENGDLPPPPPPPEPSPPEARPMTDSAAEGEIVAGELELTTMKERLQKLEEDGVDTMRARQSLRMAEIYINRNKTDRASKHLHKLDLILKDLEPQPAEPEGTGVDLEKKPVKEIPRVPPPPGFIEKKARKEETPPPKTVRKVRKVRKLKKPRGGD
jgi:hypothetical protein